MIDRALSDGEVRQTKTGTRRTVDLVAPRWPPTSTGCGRRWPTPDGLVIANLTGGILDLDNWRSRTWADACEAAGVSATPYDGRHTFASLLIHEGRSLPYVAAALGHASATTLRHYADVMDEARLGTAAPMVETIAAARAELEARDVRPECARSNVRVLRAPTAVARTA